ncbi:hypothetical protein Avbf_17995 [Armadillidium vulgare]|nr:hypothetical protein Avbf_17995 [Armadillidium vulgare]
MERKHFHPISFFYCILKAIFLITIKKNIIKIINGQLNHFFLRLSSEFNVSTSATSTDSPSKSESSRFCLPDILMCSSSEGSSIAILFLCSAQWASNEVLYLVIFLDLLFQMYIPNTSKLLWWLHQKYYDPMTCLDCKSN